MHPNKVFRQTTKTTNLGLAHKRSFGVLAVNSENAPLLSHIPFLMSDDGSSLEFHLVRSNPIVRLIEQPIKAVIAVSGGDTYISPDWYDLDDQVPTWNYVAVHIRGTVKRLDDKELYGLLDRLSTSMESRLAPKIPWRIDKLDDTYFSKFSRMIVPFSMDVHDIEGTWKLSQNKPSKNRKNAITGIMANGIGMETDGIATMMDFLE